jgi:hypothetical protein
MFVRDPDKRSIECKAPAVKIARTRPPMLVAKRAE